MSITTTIASEIIKALFSLFQSRGMKPKETEAEFFAKIKRHLTEALNWSQQVQFYGMSEGESTDDSTISLDIETIPRRFQGTVDGISKRIAEAALLEGFRNYLLLGAPGSGKTTTLKRLARLLILSPPQCADDVWQYPVIVRLANTDNHRPLYRMIAEALGIPYEKRLIRTGDNWRHSNEIFEYYVSEQPLEFIIPEILDSTGALLMLDGLDEVVVEWRDLVEREIEALALRLDRSKILLTCRTGDYNRSLGAFAVVEICPLEPRQIDELCSKWLPEPEKFSEALAAVPYADLANRPLFLSQLIVHFRHWRCLPDRPADVYHKIIRLSLEKWDEERRIHRSSRYARFDPERKLEFLSALAYHLTYEIKVKSFSTKMLIAAYSSICRDFGLPSAEAEQVAREIETHTGLVFETRGMYEFSHLSLQEYLCAYYLVREPFAEFMLDYLRQYPSPVAVAVSLAASPSNWFASLILARYGKENVDGRTLATLLSRLLQEQPHFSTSENLGFAVLKLAFDYLEQFEECVQPLLTSPNVRESVVKALSCYEVELREKVCFRLADSVVSKYHFDLPQGGELTRPFMMQLLSSCELQMETVDLSGRALVLFRRASGELI